MIQNQYRRIGGDPIKPIFQQENKRLYSTYNDNKIKKDDEPVPVKAMLKTFFRLVHPDFFSDFPAEKVK
jgi:hypothetical protein